MSVAPIIPLNPSTRSGASQLPFRQVWLYDFEFRQEDGGCPKPICMVAHEVHSSRTLRLWESELLGLL
jgi:hypothetical protein